MAGDRTAEARGKRIVRFSFRLRLPTGTGRGTVKRVRRSRCEYIRNETTGKHAYINLHDEFRRFRSVLFSTSETGFSTDGLTTDDRERGWVAKRIKRRIKAAHGLPWLEPREKLARLRTEPDYSARRFIRHFGIRHQKKNPFKRVYRQNRGTIIVPSVGRNFWGGSFLWTYFFVIRYISVKKIFWYSQFLRFILLYTIYINYKEDF